MEMQQTTLPQRVIEIINSCQTYEHLKTSEIWIAYIYKAQPEHLKCAYDVINTKRSHIDRVLSKFTQQHIAEIMATEH
jgi:hypothetical protein